MKKRAECISFANHKGGTGKTTSCISIAGWLAKKGQKVLVVDFDPQANATSGLGIDVMSLKYSIYDAVLNHCEVYEGVPVAEVIVETEIENLHLAPSEMDLSISEVIMQQCMNKSGVLNRMLSDVRTFYDFILIDLPTSPGLLKINGLCASDIVIVPVDPSIFSLEALYNLRTTFHDIKQMTGRPVPQLISVLIRYARPGMFSEIFGKSSQSQEVGARLKEIFDTVFTIPESKEIYESQKEGAPISHYAPNSKAGRAYEQIAMLLMNKS